MPEGLNGVEICNRKRLFFGMGDDVLLETEYRTTVVYRKVGPRI